jgi:hypothetical protein
VIAPPYTTFTILNDPDAGQGSGQGTFAEDINLEGEVAGSYIDANGVSHGFVTSPPYTTFASFDPTGSVAAFLPAALGLNVEGAVTGLWVDSNGVFHGFRSTPNQRLWSFDFPIDQVFDSGETGIRSFSHS